MPQKLNIYKNRIAVYYAFRMNIKTILERGVDEVIERDHLEGRLAKGDKLRVKLGIDPTASNLHLGHTVVLRKLRQFQDLGHQAVLIIGDFTGLIGDPSGRSAERPLLTEADVKENMRDYLKQAGKVLDLKKLEVRYNSEWFKDKKSDFIMDLMSRFTVARSLERDDFQKRLKANEDLSVTEILYPLLQGYDSVAIKADVELGGTDQKFNLLTGRRVQRRFGLPEQDILTVPLLVGLDGERKMSKSLGNYIGLSDQPAEMYAKVMSWADETMLKAFELLTDVDMAEVKVWQKQLGPRDFKARLAFEVTKIFHGERG